AGFEDSPRDLPAWYARTLNASISFSNVVNNAGNNTGSSATTSVQSTIDLNHDGVLDRVATQWTDEEGNAEGEETSSVTYGSYPPPYLLSTVENNQGGQTGIGYRSLATVSPSGDWSELQDTPNVKHLANVIETLDGITGASSRLVFEYDDGKFDRGIFAGFAGRSKTMSLDETIKGKTEYEYSLIEDLEPVITTQTQYDASSVSTGMGKGSSSNSFKRRFMIETTYKAVSGDRSAFYLPSQRTITEYGGVSGSATSVIDFTWDEFGNLITYKHNGGGDPSLAIDVHYEYVADSANSFFRIAQQTISGTSGAVSQTTYYYDNHSGATETLTQGVLTQEDKSAGWTDGGEGLDDQRLSIQYGRGSRGEMTSVLDVATGEKIDQTFGFGGAVLETQTNALGHKLVRSIDERGRIASIKDNNGLMLLTTYDDFNREIKKEVTGTDGKTQTLKENEYTRSAWPYYSQQKLY
ncbi:MAG TPA: toxin TcdB middle/N-terminal domain-containing protein, partial [bacterium]|nr:toxin TcdB middle/N-terminal domain-containing protein [bacterium]